MAETSVTVVELVRGVASGDVPTGVVASTPADGWSVPVTKDWMIFRLVGPAGGDTVVFKAGDRPPSLKAPLGDLSVTLAANDVKFIAVEKARHMRNDGTLLVTCGDGATTLQAIVTYPGVTAG